MGHGIAYNKLQTPAFDGIVRTVNREPLDAWIKLNEPEGLAKLSILARVSKATLTKARLGRAPRKVVTLLAICNAIGRHIDEVFPPLGRSQAV